MGVNTKALKGRIRSVTSTMHITKAMELVASSKIKRARARMEEGRFYRQVLMEAFSDLAASDTVYSREREGLPTLYILIAGDRGLAGGYNNNVFKLASEHLHPEDTVIPVGNRAMEFCARRGVRILDGKRYTAEGLGTPDCASFAARVKEMYDRGEIGRVVLISTRFLSMLSQEAGVEVLLPLARGEGGTKSTVTYEPDPESVLSSIIVEYLAGVAYCAACESLACELASRRSAMDTATKNAESMIEELNLQYNRARQSAITQEITEIVAGAGQ